MSEREGQSYEFLAEQPCGPPADDHAVTMTLEQAVHNYVGGLNYLMVTAHEEFGSNFNIELKKDGETGIYLIAVEVMKHDSKL